MTERTGEDAAHLFHAALTWAQRLKRVFRIDIETNPACDGTLRILAKIDDPAVIRNILVHERLASGIQ